jgi:hypothetical protein
VFDYDGSVADLRSIRNRGMFAVLVLVLIALWFFKMALRLSGAAMNIALLAVGVLLVLTWIGRKARGDKSV